jgi:hypothetical protein
MADVDKIIKETKADIKAALAAGKAFIDQLLAAAEAVSGVVTPGPFNYATVPTVQIPQFSTGLRPSVDIGEATSPPAAPAIDISAIQDIVLPVDDLLAPTNEFLYFETAYESTLLDPLKAKLLSDLVNGGFGIDTADEQALLQRARDRETALAMTRVDEVGRTMAARGFPMAADERAIHQARAHQDMQNKMSGLDRDIYVNRAGRFVENRQFTIQEVRQLETVLIGFHNSVRERALNVARATAEFAIAIYREMVNRYRIRVDAAKVTADVELGRIRAEQARASALIEVYRGQIVAYEANLRRLVDGARLRVDLYRADIAGDANIRGALQAQAALQQEVIRATTQQNIQISQLAVEDARVRLLETLEIYKTKVQAAAKGAELGVGQITALASGINALAVQTEEQ